MKALASLLSAVVLPPWAKWAAILALALAVYGLGRLHEARRGERAMNAYKAAQAAETLRIAKRQAEAAAAVQTRYVERIERIYLQGATIENAIPTYIQPADVDRFAVPAGFVRVLDAAWSGEAGGPASDSDREPAALRIDELARIETGNAISCRAWRAQALGWRDFYARQQVAVNGSAGGWYEPPPE